MRVLIFAAIALLATGAAAPTAVPPDGAALFASRCAMCHAQGDSHPGTIGLRQLSQSQPVLARRTDLTEAYVKAVVRGGLGPMPALTPTWVSDRDLDSIARYLAAPK